MSGKGIVVLGALLAVLALGYWFTQRSEKQARVEEDAAKRIFQFAADDIKGISITRKEDPMTVASRTDGKWAIAAPYALSADQKRLDRMAESAAGLISDRALEVGSGDLPQYGLDKPSLRVTLTADGKERHLEFGGMAPTQDHRYARLDGGPVLLVRNEGASELDVPLLEMRNRKMVDAEQPGIGRFEFAWMSRGDDGKPVESVPVRAEKRDDGRWYLTAPVEGAAEQDPVKNLAAMLWQMPGRDFVDAPENLADYGLEPPKARLTAWPGPDAAPQTVYVGALAKVGEAEGIYVKRADAPAVFVVEQGFPAHFPRTPDAFLARTLLTYPAVDLEKVHFRRGDVDIVLENDPDRGWRMTQPAAERTDQEAASEFIDRLKGLNVKDFVREGAAAAVLEPPTMTFDLALKNDRKATIVIGQPTPEGDFYALQDTGTPAIVPRDRVTPLEVEPFFFQTKEIFEFSEDNAIRVVLHLDGVGYVFERSGEDWLIREPSGREWGAPGDARLLLRALSSVRATGIAPAPADAKAYGLDVPVLTAEVTTSGAAPGQEDKTYGPLTVGSPSEGDSQRRYAAVAGKPEVYLVPQTVLTLARKALEGLRNAQ